VLADCPRRYRVLGLPRSRVIADIAVIGFVGRAVRGPLLQQLRE